MNNKLIAIIAGVVAVLFFVAAGIYIVHPANALPGFFPGFDPTSMKHHYKHAIGAFLLGLGALAYVWFTTGKSQRTKKSNDVTPPTTTQ